MLWAIHALKEPLPTFVDADVDLDLDGKGKRKGRVALVGDAVSSGFRSPSCPIVRHQLMLIEQAHAMTPHLGIGAGMGIEASPYFFLSSSLQISPPHHSLPSLDHRSPFPFIPSSSGSRVVLRSPHPNSHLWFSKTASLTLTLIHFYHSRTPTSSPNSSPHVI